MNQKIIDKVESKFYELQEKRMLLSSELAEESHHDHCAYACCGEHNDFADFSVCPVCKMTPKIQDEHNEDWWAIVDTVEGNDPECSKYARAEFLLAEWLRSARNV
jgi:hypothetical protein